MTTNHDISRLSQITIVILLCLLVVQVGGFIVLHSHTYDETAYIGAGISYVKTGQLLLDINAHPPFLKYLIGICLSFSRPVFNWFPPPTHSLQSYSFGYQFLYENSVSPEVLTALARLPSLFLSLLLGISIFLWARRLWGVKGGCLSFAVFVFEPNILAHSGLATMDVALTTFLFVSFFNLWIWLETKRFLNAFVSAIFGGLAIATKMPGVMYFPILFCLAGYYFLVYGKGDAFRQKSLMIQSIFGFLLVPIFVVVLFYQVRFFPEFFRLFDFLFDLVFNSREGFPFHQFLHGSLNPAGHWNYFLVAFLIKTTIPFLVLVSLGIFVRSDWKKKGFLLLPVGIYMGVLLIAKYQNGLRYALPVFPFLIVMIGGITRLGNKKLLMFVVPLLIFSIVESARTFPHYLTYFNQFIGGSKNGSKWLVSSDLDWGQSFPYIRDYLVAQGNPHIILALSGNASRDYYFGPHQDLTMDPLNPTVSFQYINPIGSKKEFLLVSAYWLRGVGSSDPMLFQWLENRNPEAIIQNQTFVFDISEDIVSQIKIGRIYKRNGQNQFALRQFMKALRLNPVEPNVCVELGIVYERLGKRDEAQKYYQLAMNNIPDDQERWKADVREKMTTLSKRK